jgi:hypothetical protein
VRYWSLARPVQQGRQPVHSAWASGETSRSHIPGGQLGQSGEAARRLGRISHDGLPGMRPSRWPPWCQRGALIRACAADPGAVG